MDSPPVAAAWIRREIAALADELPDRVEARVRAAGFLIPAAPPIQYRVGPIITLPSRSN